MFVHYVYFPDCSNRSSGFSAADAVSEELVDLSEPDQGPQEVSISTDTVLYIAILLCAISEGLRKWKIVF